MSAPVEPQRFSYRGFPVEVDWRGFRLIDSSGEPFRFYSFPALRLWVKRRRRQLRETA